MISLISLSGRPKPARVRAVAALSAAVFTFIVPATRTGTSAQAAPTQLQSAPGKSASTKSAPTKPAPTSSGALQSFAQTLPGSAVKVEMISVPAGALTIAGKKVPIKPFWIASTETTWEAMDSFISSGPPSVAYDQTKYAADAIARPSRSYIPPDLGWGHHGFPAINISFLSATMFCRWLSKQTGKNYRLPTEAEWEYACRTGVDAPVKLTAAQLDKIAWYAGNSKGRTHLVGKKLPNAWKLYDMYGNAGEWATDLDGKPVLCGGTWKDKIGKIVPTERKRQTPEWQATDPQLPKSRWWLSDGDFIGFRIVCEP